MKLFLIITTFCLSYGCSSPAAKTAAPEPLLPIHLHLSGRFFLPECEGYGDIPLRNLVVVPTVQEAKLSGFHAAAECSDEVVEARLARERALFGDMKATPATETRQAQLLLRRQLRRIEQQQDDIRNDQEEMKRKMEEGKILNN